MARVFAQSHETSVEDDQHTPLLTKAATFKCSSAPPTPATDMQLDDQPLVQEGLGQTKSKTDEAATDASPSSQGDIPDPFSPFEIPVVSAENAQAVLPPSACVFVANLMQSRNDEELQKSVLEVFQEYGKVYVKIRRDSRNMPFAFCQYENDKDATQAVTQGRRALIDGRPCRTERARANRALYMSRLNGGKVTKQEASAEMERFGEIESMWFASPTDRQVHNLPEGVWVKFVFYQACRDAQGGYRDHSVFRVEQIEYRRRGQKPPQSGQAQSKAIARIEQAEAKTIYVGNLSPVISHSSLAEVFGKYGNIVGDIHVVRRKAGNGYPLPGFAFISYYYESCAKNAIQHENANIVHGYAVKVQLKSTPGKPYTKPFTVRARSVNAPWRQHNGTSTPKPKRDEQNMVVSNRPPITPKTPSPQLSSTPYNAMTPYHNGGQAAHNYNSVQNLSPWHGVNPHNLPPSWPALPPTQFSTPASNGQFYNFPSPGYQYSPIVYQFPRRYPHQQFAWPVNANTGTITPIPEQTSSNNQQASR